MTRDFLIGKLAVRGFPIGVKFGFLGLFLCTSFAAALFLCARTYAPIVDRSVEEARAHEVAAAVALALEQWTVYDDQLDIYAALIALRDPGQKSLEVTAIAEAGAARKAIDSPLAAMETVATDPDSRALITRFRHGLTAYDAYTARMLELAGRGDISQAVHIQTVENDAASDESIDSLTALGKSWNARAGRANAAVATLAAYGARPMVPIGLVMLLLTAVVLTLVGRSIALPLGQLTIVARKLAAANVDVDDDLPPSGSDEIGLLSKSFGEMILKRRHVEERLAFAAFHDGLTGLANRALLMERLRQLVAKRYSGDHQWAILFLDLDRFKVINDSLGHSVGDLVLIEAARRLERCLRSGDTLARLGGDEFIILLDGITNVSSACTVADRVLREFDAAFVVGGNEVFAGTSIGIATSRNGDDRPEDVLRNADIAMYRAKQLGKQRYELFSTELLTRAVALQEIETDLARALEREEFCLYYQPIVGLHDGRLTGFEALVRWQHPRRGLVPPNEFIGLAEETGAIVPIGDWILREACRQLAVWRAEFAAARGLKMSVNVSAKQLATACFAQTVADALSACGLPAANLSVEVTESALVTDAEAARSMLAQLQDLGVDIHLDDFGTGYSSLGYLHKFPIGALKIDRSFVSDSNSGNAGDGLANAEIVRAIVALTKSLALTVTAEGVETDAQREQLAILGCTHGQGYYFARPVDASTAGGLIAESVNGTPILANRAAPGSRTARVTAATL